MKKILLLTILVFIVSFSFSQSKRTAYQLETGSWNEYSKTWDFREPIATRLVFKLSKTYVMINDEANTHLSILNDTNDDDNSKYKSHSWMCNDEKGRKCTFMMTTYKSDGQTIYVIIYSDICFRYSISAQLDKF